MHRATQQPRENCPISTLQTLDLEAAFSSSLCTGPFLYYFASATPAAAAASVRRFIKFLYATAAAPKLSTRDNRNRRFPVAPTFDCELLKWVTGGESLSEYIFSELPQIADVVRSRFTIRRTHSYCGLRVLGPSNSMLSGGPTTPQDYPEKSGFARRRERECGHRRHWADTTRRPAHAHLHH